MFVFVKIRLLGKILRLVSPPMEAMLECKLPIVQKIVLKPQNKEAKKTAVSCKDSIEKNEKESYH